MDLDFVLDKLKERGYVFSNELIQAISSVSRDLFVPSSAKSKANKDEPLSIPCGHTISAPHMVAIMLSENIAPVRPHYQVLEVGTGSGYNAAIIASMLTTGHLFTIERHAELVEYATKRLENWKSKLTIVHGDGTLGIEGTQFDRIYVTASGPYVPDPLIAQLKSEGVLVMPISRRKFDVLVRVTKKRGVCHFLNSASKYKGEVSCEAMLDVRFVPLIGKYGFSKSD